MQFQADLLRVPVVRPRTTETTALARPTWRDSRSVLEKSRAIAALWSADRTFRRGPRPPSRAACWPSGIAPSPGRKAEPSARRLPGKAPVNQLFFYQTASAGLQPGSHPGKCIRPHYLLAA